MTDTLTHRGPDEAGLYLDGPVGLGHRRLSIIDITSGQQPMQSEDGAVVLSFNGEIYNYRELRRSLKDRGHRFVTSSDTEVILALYREFGVSTVEHLRGMFAFAIWDVRQRRLVLARDRVGIKPVYYAQTSNALVFGSEMKAVLASGLVDDALDNQALDDFFAHAFIRAPRSIFAMVKKLEPGHVLVASLDGQSAQPRVDLRRYWRLPVHGGESCGQMTPHHARRELLRLLEDAVRMRLIAEVPLGAFLSGGIDSSTVVWLMSRVSSEPVRTFSIGFREGDYDERRYARAVARRFGTKHEEEIVSPDAVATLPHVLAAHDEPFGDPSSIPTWYVCRMARRHVTVCLSGDGGDELFAGYRRYAVIARERAVTKYLPQRLLAQVSRLGKLVLSPEAKRRNFVERMATGLEPHYASFRAIFTPAMRRRLFSPEFHRTLDVSETARLMAKVPVATLETDPISPLLASDFTSYLPDDVLTKVDRMSMAHSLECRVPFLDHEVVEFVTKLPISHKLHGGVSKRLLRSLVAPHLPPEVLSHRKQGFSVPLRDWLRNELRGQLHDAIHGRTLRETGMFQPAYLQRVEQIHQSGRRDLSWHLWQILIMDQWLQRTGSDSDPLFVSGS
jgi:asparagine synthase (glutamine-hydrolysing)